MKFFEYCAFITLLFHTVGFFGAVFATALSVDVYLRTTAVSNL